MGRNDREDEHEIIELLKRLVRRVERIEHLLEFPTLTAYQVGDDPMAIGNITAGQTGQFGCAVNFPSGVTAPAGYSPVLTPASPDPLITFAPATVDLSSGAIPLSQQFVATVDPTDTNTSGQVAFSALGTDGVTVLTSNIVTFTITPGTVGPPPPPTEPTLVASQLG